MNVNREFFLLWVLGRDLPGGITVEPAGGGAWLPGSHDDEDDGPGRGDSEKPFRFSLAGVQLKFSAVMEASGGLTIPAEGVGGSWIVKFPSMKFEGVVENEFAMMTLARMIERDVPDVELVDVEAISDLPEGIGRLKGTALDIKRFAAKARLPEKLVVDAGTETVHRFMDVWTKEKGNLPLSAHMIEVIEEHIRKIELVREGTRA